MSKSTVLIVEDEATLLKALVYKFEKEGYAVVTAEDGEEALVQAFEFHPDLILLDMVMPVMDGMSVLQKLHQDEWGKTVPVILLTNLDDGKTASEAFDHGAHGFLVKSRWTIDEVIERVEERLEEIRAQQDS